MLHISTGPQTRNRREFLQIGTLALGGLALPDLLETQAAMRAQGRTVRNKSIVMLFLTGGPSQIETFDPKMMAPSDVRSITGEVKTPLFGVTFGATFSRMARLADRMAVVRSFTHGESDHTKAVQQVMRGGNNVNDAGLGSIVARLRGTNHVETGMPTQVYISAKEADKQFNKERLRLLDAAGAGQMGGAYGPFPAGSGAKLADNMQLRIIQPRLDDRIALRRTLDRLNRQIDIRGTLGDFDKFEAQALDILLGRAKSAFDVTREDPRLLARYDTSHFAAGIHQDQASSLGHQMLLARRLCEAGCGFVTVHNPGWDMHGGPTQYNMPNGMRELGGPVDHAVSAFLEDVGARGLSEEILLIITGEFGRTTRIKDNGGRDHWPRLSTLAFAGGGLKMGQVVGQSNAHAGEPQSEPITLDHLFATVMHTLFDVSSLRLEANLPRDIAELLERGQPIPQLM